MINGRVNPFREAVIRFKIRGPNGVEAVIDTGFSDYLTLPSVLIRSLNLLAGGVMRGTLADGSEIDMNVFTLTALWDSQPLSIIVVEADGGPLVRMALLYGYHLSIDVVDGGAVTVLPLQLPP